MQSIMGLELPADIEGLIKQIIIRAHQGLHCLLRQCQSSEKEIQYFFGNYNLRPLNINNGPS